MTALFERIMLFRLLLLIFFVQTVTLSSAYHFSNSTECIDHQLTGTIEYVSTVRYKMVGTLSKSFACTMVTQCSADRLHALLKQMRGWQGATSVAVYVPAKDPAKQKAGLETIDSFLKALEGDATFVGHLTVSILYGHEGQPQLWNCTEPDSPGMPLYPINALRNLAAAATGTGSDTTVHVTPYLMYLDADFVPSVGLSAWIDKQAALSSSDNTSFIERTKNGDLVVIPAFESKATIPAAPTRSLQYLLDGMQADTIHGFHVKRYPAGHGNTDFEKWKELSAALKSESADHPFHPYEVKYTQGFEPYVIMARSAFVPYDERFRGYGFNKCVNLRWLADNGRQFYVLPGHFVVEDAHPNSITYKKTAGNLPVLFGAYKAARSDVTAGRMPLISQNTAQFLRAAGFEKVATEDPVTHENFMRNVVPGVVNVKSA